MNLLQTLLLSTLVINLGACNSAANKQQGTDKPSTTVSHAEPVRNLTGTGVVNVSNAELLALQQRGVKLIDIRLPQEWQQTGVINNSQLLTFFNADGSINPQFVSKATALAPQGSEVAIICRTGNRTQTAADMLVKAGIYPRVYNVTEGITGWIGADRPVTAVNNTDR